MYPFTALAVTVVSTLAQRVLIIIVFEILCDFPSTTYGFVLGILRDGQGKAVTDTAGA